MADTICAECRHERPLHEGDGACHARVNEGGGYEIRCGCAEFVPSAVAEQRA